MNIRWPKFSWFMSALVLALVPSIFSLRLLWIWSDRAVQEWSYLKGATTERTRAVSTQRFDAALKAADLVVKGIGLPVTIAGGFVLFLNFQNSIKNTQLTQANLTTERFAKAVEQLKDDQNSHIRLGGIYTLFRIARDSPNEYESVVKILSSFIRNQTKYINQTPPIKPGDDVQEALNVLGVLSSRYSQENSNINNFFHIDLSGSDLRGAVLHKGNFRKANFRSANLSNIDFTNTDFPYAIFSDSTNLKNSVFNGSNLTGADFRNSDLTEAKLVRAKLDYAKFENSTLEKSNLSDSKIRHSTFYDANLAHADLRGSDLTEARLNRATLDHAKFDRAILASASLVRASVDRATLSQAKSLTQLQKDSMLDWSKAL